MSIGSPTAFLLWAILSSIFLAFLVLHLWSYDRFNCLRWSAGRQPGTFKRVMTYSYLATVPLLVVFCVAITVIKYNEGYMVAPDGLILPRPIAMYSPFNRRWLLPLYFVLSTAWSLELVTHLEELTFWLYLLHQGPGKREWFHSWEFRTWCLGSMVAVLGMPITTLVTRRDLKACIAWIFLVGSSAGTATTIFFLYVLVRFPGFLRHVKAGGADPDVVVRLATFYQLHKIRVMFRFLFHLPLVVLSLDGLVDGPHTIVLHPFSSDFLLMMGCIGSCISSAITLLIFFPRSITQESGYRAKLQSPFNNTKASGGIIVTTSSYGGHGTVVPPPNYYPHEYGDYHVDDERHYPSLYPFSFPPSQYPHLRYEQNADRAESAVSIKSPADRMSYIRYPGASDGSFTGQVLRSRSRSRSRSWVGGESDGESVSGSCEAGSEGYEDTDEGSTAGFTTEREQGSVKSRRKEGKSLGPQSQAWQRDLTPTDDVGPSAPQRLTTRHSSLPAQRRRDRSKTDETITPPRMMARDGKQCAYKSPSTKDPSTPTRDAHRKHNPQSTKRTTTRPDDILHIDDPTMLPTSAYIPSSSKTTRNFGLDDIPLSTRRFSDGPTSTTFERNIFEQGQAGKSGNRSSPGIGTSSAVRDLGAPTLRVSKPPERRVSSPLHPYVMNFTSPIDLFDESADDAYLKQVDLRR